MSDQPQKKDEIVKYFILAARSHHHLFERKVSEFGVHRSQHKILMFLSRHGESITTQKDIAKNFDISAAAVAVSVRKLETDGLISRIADERDNRSNIISLTEQGKKVVEKTKSLISSIDEAMFDGFDDNEIVQFSSYLSRLCDNIRDYGKQ